ncbi:hypothetical protein C8R48DRAFT_797648 [Suillus tomentosus]|nr:hypothetical protein C8R48DRAFT_797648 [Suillus tomentosus]
MRFLDSARLPDGSLLHILLHQGYRGKSLSATLAKYIFSKKYNFIEGRDASAQPVMLARFLGNFSHTFTHVGYGAELGIPGMIVEGEEPVRLQWKSPQLDLASLSLNTKAPTAPSQVAQPPKNHAFSILAEIMQDPTFTPKKIKQHFRHFDGLMSEHGDTIWDHAKQWTIDPSEPGEIERKNVSGQAVSSTPLEDGTKTEAPRPASFNSQVLCHFVDTLRRFLGCISHAASLDWTLKGYFKDTELEGAGWIVLPFGREID